MFIRVRARLKLKDETNKTQQMRRFDINMCDFMSQCLFQTLCLPDQLMLERKTPQSHY